jgi:hypothetical protein
MDLDTPYKQPSIRYCTVVLYAHTLTILHAPTRRPTHTSINVTHSDVARCAEPSNIGPTSTGAGAGMSVDCPWPPF